MSDAQAYDDESLPWLEAVENDEGPRAISARKMLVGLILILLAVAVVAGTMFWLGRQDAAPGGAPQLIQAEPGPYKVKPADPGGLDVAGDSETAYSTSAGEDPDAALDVRKLPPEMTPLPVETPQPATPPKKIPPKEVKEPATGRGRQAGRAGGADDPAWRLCIDRQGRHRLEAVVGPLPASRRAEQGGGDRECRRQVGLPAAGLRLVGSDQGGLRRVEGGGRKLPAGELMQAAIYGLAGTELLAEERDFFRDSPSRPAIFCSSEILSPGNSCDSLPMPFATSKGMTRSRS